MKYYKVLRCSQFRWYIYHIALRSVLVRFSFGSRSVLVRFSFGSHSVLDRFSFGSRSILVHPSFILRSFFVRESKIDRRMNGESSEARRRCVETLVRNQEKDDSNKNFIFNHLNSNYYGNLMNFARCPKNMRGVRRLKQAICLFLVSK